jgi:hypothetical protein
MPETAYARFRRPLAALADDAWIMARFADPPAGASWNGGRSWIRRYGRFEPEREPFASLVLEGEGEPQTLGLLEAFAEEPAHAHGAIQDEVVGWIRLRPFTSDEGLPTLPAVLSRPGRRRVVRYRPHRQCTIHFEGEGHGLFAKVFPDERGERVHAEAVALWEASARGELAFRVARPVRWDRAERALWHEELTGEPVVDRLRSAQGPELAERMGTALASLSRSRLAPAGVFDGDAQLRHTSRCGEELSRQVPRLRSLIRVILERVSHLHGRARPHRLRPIHGAPHAHQWLDDGGQFGLLDFDRISMGEPELDVATVLAEMDFENRARVPVAEINRRLLAGYESAGGTLDPELLLAYRAHKRLEKALKTLRTVRSDGDLRAARRCEYAAALLESVQV